MAPVVLNNVIPFQQAAGQHLWATSHIRRKEFVDFYEANPTKYLSGPASMIIFINAFQLAYTIKLGEFKYDTPGYNAVEKDLRANVPLRLKVRDIVDSRSLTIEPTMRDLKRFAADTKIFSSLIWYAHSDGMGMLSSRKTEMNELMKKPQRNYKLLTNDVFNKTMKSNLQSPWRSTCLITNFDSCLLYGLQNDCGSHFGLIAAHNEAKEQVLVLDVKYGPNWVKFESLMKAMHTVSTESGFPRGMIEIDMIII